MAGFEPNFVTSVKNHQPKISDSGKDIVSILPQ